MSKEQDTTINLGPALIITTVAVCAIGFVTLGVFGSGDTQRKVDKAAVEKREKNLDELETAMAKERSSYAFISKDKGTVQLPLERAMQLTLRDLKRSTPRPSGVPVIPVTVPAPAAADEGTAEQEEVVTQETEAETEPATVEQEASE